MPKISREMSALEVSRLKKEGTYAVGGVPGLYLQILGGSRAWVLRFVLPERRLRRRMGLGAYPAVTLAQARERAREAHALVDQGIDPIQARRDVVRQAARKKSISFRDACAEYIAARGDVRSRAQPAPDPGRAAASMRSIRAALASVHR